MFDLRSNLRNIAAFKAAATIVRSIDNSDLVLLLVDAKYAPLVQHLSDLLGEHQITVAIAVCLLQ